MRDPLGRRRWARRFRGRTRRIVLAVLVLLVVVGGGWLVLFSPYLTAEKVDVTGLRTLDAVRVRHQARVPIGTPLARVDLAAIQARVESIGTVESAAVSRSWPHTVHIAVTERTPVAVVDRGAGLQDVDASGVLFGNVPRRPHGLPLIKASAGTTTDALAGAGQIAAALPPGLARKVNYLQLHSVDDVVLLLRDGREVLWGSAADSDQKARVAAELLRRKVSQVDVSVPGRPTTR